jgi:hypothetical protein
MNKLLNVGALLAFGFTTSVAALAQTPEELEADTVITRDVRALTPEVSRALKITRTPLPPSPLLVGTYWSCSKHNGFDICRIKLVVCTTDQTYCVEI